MSISLFVCISICLYLYLSVLSFTEGIISSPWGWLDDVIDTAKEAVEKAVDAAEDAGDVSISAAEEAYNSAKKVVEKAFDAAEEANYGVKLKNVAEDAVDAFKDVANFMSHCSTSLPNPVSDKLYLQSLESQTIPPDGSSWMSLIPNSRRLSNITIPGD